MATSCPKCGADINAFKVASHFPCPTCSAKLKGRTGKALIAVVVTLAFAELITYPLAHSIFSIDWQAAALYIGIDTCLFVLSYTFFVGVLGEIESES